MLTAVDRRSSAAARTVAADPEQSQAAFPQFDRVNMGPMTAFDTFAGLIGRTPAESVPDWTARPAPPPGSPNVVYVVLDDVGFSDLGCYGSEISTPVVDSLAGRGLRYTRFHTTALCSPTRAALLTGRNHHAVGMGGLSNWDLGYPGYRGHVSKRAATIAELLRQSGWSTFAVGKWHLAPMAHTSAAGPYDYWPLQQGFERFYGFLDGETNHHHPALTQDNTHLPVPDEPDYFLTVDLVERAAGYVRDVTSVAPERPFFLYLAFGAAHAPHQAPAGLIAKYEAVFEKGWDRTRVDRLERQKHLGVVRAATELPPSNPGVARWDSLGADERRLAVRLQACYAAMVEHTDRELGRLVAELDRLGRLDSTAIVLLSDNGASQEGTPLGCVNMPRTVNGAPNELAYNLAHLDKLGGQLPNNNYPWGWAMAGNTPLRWYKQNVHAGGIRDPLIVVWPGDEVIPTRSRGQVRYQFHHVNDVTPTVLDLLDLDLPAAVNGHPQIPLAGTSMRYTFAPEASDPAAVPSTKHVQYFEMIGNRGIVVDGWKAVARRDRNVGVDDDRWELYHIDEDENELHDLAKSEGDRLARMQQRFFAEAGRHGALPVGPGIAWGRPQPGSLRDRRRFVYYPGSSPIPLDASPEYRDRSWTMTAELSAPGNGVLYAHGDFNGGVALLVAEGHPMFVYNAAGDPVHCLRSSAPLPGGACTLTLHVSRTGSNRARATLTVGGRETGAIDIPRTMNFVAFVERVTVGYGTAPGVGGYTPPAPFTGGLERLVIELEDDQGGSSSPDPSLAAQ
jgi:arylsulfatase